jgi:hypothetical protein
MAVRLKPRRILLWLSGSDSPIHVSLTDSNPPPLPGPPHIQLSCVRRRVPCAVRLLRSDPNSLWASRCHLNPMVRAAVRTSKAHRVRHDTSQSRIVSVNLKVNRLLGRWTPTNETAQISDNKSADILGSENCSSGAGRRCRLTRL